MKEFKAILQIIGINPYVEVPGKILAHIFKQAGREKGPVPVCGTVNDKPYKQTLVKFRGEWRLYINTFMLPKSPQRIGETISVTIGHDPVERTIPMHPRLAKALKENKEAKAVFDSLSPSRRLARQT